MIKFLFQDDLDRSHLVLRPVARQIEFGYLDIRGTATMADRFYVRLDDRGVLALTGDDRYDFLQGLISNDVRKIAPGRAIYAALLTPQGKFLHDFMVAAHDDSLLIDCEGPRRDDLRQRLSRYRLRSKVQIADATDRFGVAVLVGADAARLLGLDGDTGAESFFTEGAAFVDPRLPDLGVRLIAPREVLDAVLARTGLPEGSMADWDLLRLRLGVPDGSRDLPIEKAFLLESGFDELNGVDWQKGCYVGQELTARTKYRGLVRKRLFPIEIDGPTPEPGTPVMLGDRHAGEMRSARDGRGLALLRLDALDAEARGEGRLTAGDATVTACTPPWMRLPSTAEGRTGG